MATANELALAKAKEDFARQIDEFGPLKFIQERPIAAAGIAVCAGLILGLTRFPKVKTLLLSPPVLGLIKKKL